MFCRAFDQTPFLLRVCLCRCARLDSVDCIILDSPHYFNSHELQIDKYYSRAQVKHIERMHSQQHESSEWDAAADDEGEGEQSRHSARYLHMRLRLLNDSILSTSISNEIQLETIHKGFLATIDRRKELLEQIRHLTQQCQLFTEKNENLRQYNRNRLQSNSKLQEDYEQRIRDEKLKLSE